MTFFTLLHTFLEPTTVFELAQHKDLKKQINCKKSCKLYLRNLIKLPNTSLLIFSWSMFFLMLTSIILSDLFWLIGWFQAAGLRASEGVPTERLGDRRGRERTDFLHRSCHPSGGFERQSSYLPRSHPETLPRDPLIWRIHHRIGCGWCWWRWHQRIQVCLPVVFQKEMFKHIQDLKTFMMHFHCSTKNNGHKLV